MDRGRGILGVCRSMDYCYGKNQLNFGIDPMENGQMAAILNFSEAQASVLGAPNKLDE